MKKIPAVLAAAIAIDLVFGIAIIVMAASSSSPDFLFGARWRLVNDGVVVATTVMYAVGLYDLSRSLTGLRANGAFAAMIALCAAAGMHVFWVAVAMTTHESSALRVAIDVVSHVGSSVPAVVAIGLAMAARTEDARFAVPLALLAIVLQPPRLLADLLYSNVGITTYQVMQLAGVGAQAGLIALGCRDTVPVVDPARAVRGLERAARALWLRVIGAGAMMCLLLLALLGAGTHGAESLFRLALLVGAGINVAGLLWLAAGALGAARAEVPELPRHALAVAGALVLWVGGAMLTQLAPLYSSLYGDGSPAGGDLVAAFELVLPIAVIAGIALIGVAIAVLARRRGLAELQSQASGKLAGFVALMLASVASQGWLIEKASSYGTFVFILIAATVAGAWASIVMAQLCKLGAEGVHAQQPPPVARVERG